MIVVDASAAAAALFHDGPARARLGTAQSKSSLANRRSHSRRRLRVRRLVQLFPNACTKCVVAEDRPSTSLLALIVNSERAELDGMSKVPVDPRSAATTVRTRRVAPGGYVAGSGPPFSLPLNTAPATTPPCVRSAITVTL